MAVQKIDYAFLDSGTGGIPYLVHLLNQSPGSSCIYVGDTLNFPYGEKTHEQIINCVFSVVRLILSKYNPKVFVIACNTMSVNCLDILREAFPDKKFVGTVPAIKTAGEISEKRIIGLLGTNSTVKSPYNKDLKNHFAADCKLILRGDPELISFIEHKSFTATEQQIKDACKDSIEFFRANDCDVIVLGCTHFLNIREQMQCVAGKSMKVIDSREGVVKRALSLGGKKIIYNPFNKKRACLFVTGFCNEQDKLEYDVICKKNNLDFKGQLS